MDSGCLSIISQLNEYPKRSKMISKYQLISH
jgi:hypothetical protein